jgi:GNAT superfamily N-acetyltransferase
MPRSANLTIQLQPVTGHDAPALADLRVQAMRESLEAIGRFDPQRARERFLASFTPEDTQAILADGERVGFVVIRHLPDHILLDHLYILPARQGCGIGAQILQGLFAQADRAGLPVRVGALKGSRSNDFYLRHGFVLTESAEWDNYYVRLPISTA